MHTREVLKKFSVHDFLWVFFLILTGKPSFSASRQYLRNNLKSMSKFKVKRSESKAKTKSNQNQIENQSQLINSPVVYNYKCSLCEKCPYSELFWPEFSHIRIEYEKILRISLYSVQMRGNTDQNNSEYRHFLRNGCCTSTCNNCLNL